MGVFWPVQTKQKKKAPGRARGFQPPDQSTPKPYALALLTGNFQIPCQRGISGRVAFMSRPRYSPGWLAGSSQSDRKVGLWALRVHYFGSGALARQGTSSTTNGASQTRRAP